MFKSSKTKKPRCDGFHSSKTFIPIEIPFWFAIVIWAFLPSTKTPWLNFEHLKINSKDLILIMIGSFYVLRSLFVRSSFNKRNRWSYYFPKLFYVLIIYSFLSTTWNELNHYDQAAMRYTLILSLSAFMLGYYIVTLCSFSDINSFLQRLTLFIVLAGAIYTAESFFAIGIRSVNFAFDFGIQRVRGPLFGSATGHFILLPAIAFAIIQIMDNLHYRPLWIASTLILCVTLLGTGSRTSIISGLIFICLVLFFNKSFVKRVKVSIIIGLIAFIAYAVVFSKADSSRITRFEDNTRQETHLAVWKLLKKKSPDELIVGSGYGAIWPWYIADTEGARDTGQYINRTISGSMLYHPHSVILPLIVELGAAGAFFMICLIMLLIKGFQNEIEYRSISIMGPCFCATFIAMSADYVIFKNWSLSTIWWIYLFGFLHLCSTPNKKRSINRISGVIL